MIRRPALAIDSLIDFPSEHLPQGKLHDSRIGQQAPVWPAVSLNDGIPLGRAAFDLQVATKPWGLRFVE